MFRGKNGYFFRRPDDGKFQFLQWDSDLAFQQIGYPFYADRVAPWLERPYNLKRFQTYLGRLVGLTESTRVAAWLALEKTAHPARSPEIGAYLDFFRNRNRMAAGLVPPARALPPRPRTVVLPARPAAPAFE
jgi:hypothetical protein